MNSSDDKWFEKERLHFSAQDGDLDEVKKLLGQGYSVNIFDETAYTPLHYAAMKGHAEVMKFLINAGADVNIYDVKNIGNTVLREVAGNCSFEIAKILMDAGANPNIPGWMQITALQKANQRNDPQGVLVHDLLLEYARKFKS